MSHQNLLEMDEMGRSYSNDKLPPQPKPRPRPRSKDTGSLARVTSNDDMISVLSSTEQMVEKDGPLLRKGRRNVAFSSFDNNAFIEDDAHVSDASRKSSNASNSFDEVTRPQPLKRQKAPHTSSRNKSKVLSFSANEDSESGLSTSNNAVQSMDNTKKTTMFQNKSQDDESEHSSATFSIENERYRDSNRVTSKPPIPKPKRRGSGQPRRRPTTGSEASSEERHASDDNGQNDDNKNHQTKRIGKAREHSVVEIEPERDVTDNDKGKEAEDVGNPNPASKPNVKSRLGKLFASSSKSKKSFETDNVSVGDEQNVSGESKDKGSLVNRWRKTFSRSTSKPLQEDEEAGVEIEEEKLTTSKERPSTSARDKRKLGKREDTRIFMPEEREESDASQDQEIQSKPKEKVKKKSKEVIDLEVGESDEDVVEAVKPEKKSKFKPFAKLIISKNKEKAKPNQKSKTGDEARTASKDDELKKSKTSRKPEKAKSASPIKSTKVVKRDTSAEKAEFSVSSSSEEDNDRSHRGSESEEEPVRDAEKDKMKQKKSKSKTPDSTRQNIPCVDSITGKDLLFGVTIHSSDMLPLNPNVIHPVVKVTVMCQNGKFLRRSKDAVQSIESPEKESSRGHKTEKKSKRHAKRFENEGSDEECTSNVGESVLPIMSQPCRARQSIPTFVPTWNELLVFEEHLKKFAEPDQNKVEDTQPIVFFEIMDFLPMNSNGTLVSYTGFHGSEVGWYKVAWAFLKPIGANGVRNLNKKLRLQLYKPVKLRRKDMIKSHEVFAWWKSGIRDKINCTLYVTPKGIIPPETKAASLRQLLSMRKEQLTQAILDSQLATNKKKSSKNNSMYDVAQYPHWTRMEGQSCKPPNQLVASLPASQIASLNIVVSGNVFCAKFSPCGKMLAAALDTDELHVILLFQVPSWTLLKSLRGHHGIIYEIAWKLLEVDDECSFHFLATASADSTVMVWQMQNGNEKTLTLLKVLYHPAYVYCVKFHPSHPCLLVTGCFDFILRVWDIKPDHIKIEAGKEKKHKSKSHNSSPAYLLDKHTSFVNSITFDNSGQHLFSGDGSACIFKWSCIAPSPRKTWRLEKDVKLHHGNVPVNSLSVHPAGSRLLVHLRDNFLKILDVVTLIPLQSFSGLHNERLQIRSCFSPCGNLVLSGSEDSTLCIWDADTGKILQLQSPQNHPNCVVSCVDYHPLDYYIVIGLTSTVSEPSPVLVYFYNQPKTLNYPMLKKTAMRLRKSIEDRNSQYVSFEKDPDTSSNPSKSPRPAKRVDSSEKFISIIQKLDTALYFAQQRNKQRRCEMEASACASATNTYETSKPIITPETSDIHDRKNESISMPRKYIRNNPDRPRSASSVRSKRDRFRRSNELRDTKSDSEQSHHSKHQQSVEKEIPGISNDSTKSSHPLDHNEIQQVKPKPLKRRSLSQSVERLDTGFADNVC